MPKRREFIQNGLGFISLSLTMPQFLMRAANAATTPAAVDANSNGLPPIPKGKILVVIEMAGGNDGLNTVVPYADAAYAEARPNIGIKANDVVKIGDKLGLHPSMKAMGALFEKGQVAVISGVGYPNANRSHFHSMDIWQSADPDMKQRERSGWLARYFDADGHYRGNPLSSVVLGSSLPMALSSQISPVSVIGNGRDFGFGQDGDRQKQMEALHALYQSGTIAGNNTEFISNVGNDVYTSTQTIRKALQGYDPRANTAANYPKSGLANSLQTIAKLINGDIGTRVFYASIGGFDTHANQPEGHANLLGTISEAIAAFYRDLALQGRDKDVMVMTFSEFGRRVRENGSAGTDHGAASCLFVVGGGVRGGTFGTYPSLTDLDDGDLKFNTDFRSIYSTVLDRWLGADSTRVLGGRYEPLRFL
jgi:uncharacterized protein (DUF1501 family)